MKFVLNKLISLVFATALALPSIAFSANLCRALFATSIEKVLISEKDYVQDVSDLRSTLTGKLATVWRSEWKTKLSYVESNHYVLDLVNKSLTAETKKTVLRGLDVESEGFTREVHARLYKLQTSGKLKPEDQLAVRDKPAPAGADDTTFTYYTKPIQIANGEGKHQVRVRTYIREIKIADIPVKESVQAYDANGKLITITREAKNILKVKIENDGVVESEQTFSRKEIIEQYGSTRLFAPHGKNFKLEIKTALNDEISGAKFPILAGKHMVQKLDVSLTPIQVEKLFAPLRSKTELRKAKEALERVNLLIAELVAKTPENKARIEAVFAVIKEGLLTNADFLTIEGATAYHRTAFETTTGLQTTIDRDQGVYEGQMYSSAGLKTPFLTIESNTLIKPVENDARHVELKVPVTSMENTVGIKFADPSSAPEANLSIEQNKKINDVIYIYSKYVRDNSHAGKFNFIRKNGATKNNSDAEDAH